MRVLLKHNVDRKHDRSGEKVKKLTDKLIIGKRLYLNFMKKSMFRQIAVVAAVVITLVITGSCRKNSGSTDLVIDPPKVPGTRALTVSVLNSTSLDSLSGYTLHVKSPSGESDKTVSGTRCVIANPEAGTYTFTASLNGYVSASTDLKVVLPADQMAGLSISQSILLAKSAPVVAVTATAGATVTVKENVEETAAPVVATVTVPSNTVFTLADGSKPATVNISVTNVPVAAAAAPVEVVNGVSQVQMTDVQVVAGDKIPLKTLDLQPEGLTFDKPMVIDMSIADLYPPAMSVAEKTTRQAGLVLSYVHKDGSVEKVVPDHFSADRNTAYFKISHFSKWQIVNDHVKLKYISSSDSPLQVKTAGCGEALSGTFTYESRYKYLDPTDPWLSWVMTSSTNDLVYTLSQEVNQSAVPGYSISATWKCTLEKWQVIDSDDPGHTTRNVLIPTNGVLTVNTSICHNQGNGK